MYEALIVAGSAVIIAAIKAAYMLGQRKPIGPAPVKLINGNAVGSTPPPQNGQVYMTREMCAMQRKIDELQIARKLDKMMSHMGIEDEECPDK